MPYRLPSSQKGIQQPLAIPAQDAADRHRGAIRFLDGAEIGEIGPLHGFLRIGGWARNVEAVELGHRCEVFQRARICSASSSRVRITSSLGHMSSACARSARL